MPVTVKERAIGTRRASGRGAERSYIIREAADEPTAIAALLTDPECPSSIGGLTRQDADCGVEEIGDEIWIGTAVYSVEDLILFPGETFQISFDISGQTQRITQSKVTVGKYAPTGMTAKDFRGAINVQQDGTVDGVDIIVPTMAYTVTKPFEEGEISQTYVDTVSGIVGTVNNTGYHGYIAGELMLTRVSGQRRADNTGKWDITFGFAVSRNKTNLIIAGTIGQDIFGDPTTVAGSITVASKRGWEYLWCRYEDKIVTVSGTDYVYKVPVAAYVERVYDYRDYAALNI